MLFGCIDFNKDSNRPPNPRAVTAVILGLVMIVVGCEPGPPPTPTLPPALDFTVTPTWQSPTPTVTPIPSLTASLTPLPVTITPLVTATSIELSPTETVVPEVVTAPPPTIPPPVAVTPFPTQSLAIPVTGVEGRMGVGSAGNGTINVLPEIAFPPQEVLDTPLNAGFEGGRMEQGAVEVVVPEGWTAWWRTGAIDCGVYAALATTGPCPAVDYPGLKYRRPEFSVIPADGRWLDPPRVFGDGQAARFFCTYGICEGGYLQPVRVSPGTTYVLSAQSHAWCTENTSDPFHSQVGTRDEQLNCEVALGLDPTGGLDPLGANVVWQAANIYDSFAPLAIGPVQAQGDTVTLFLRGRSLWPVRHNDFHFDAVTFTRQ